MPTPRTLKTPQLMREDWIDTAIRVLINEGVDAVQITTLAKGLNITRGSFYWHFDGRDDLLEAVITEWQRRNTGVIVGALRAAQSLDDGLLALFQVWVDHDEYDPRLDQAVREWARREADLLTRIQAEDDSRVSAIAHFLHQHGFDETEGYIRARVIYFTQVSYYALGIQEPMAKRMSYLDAYFKCFIGRSPVPKAAQAFITLHEGEMNDRDT